ncbi:MAG TPA: MFS transporter [Longimicrobiaceae bacterium]|nr:MFS transporter [Longimicrobiaceae bacterium]
MPRIATPTDSPRAPGMRTFYLVWLGQLVSSLGSGLTRFGLGVWVFEETGSATSFALILFFAVLPGILLSPIAGAYVDRWDRRRVMIATDAGAALGTLAVALLLFAGRLEMWHIYTVVAIGGGLGAFQGPAHGATTSLLVPKEQFARAMGLVQFGQAGVRIAAPVLAAALMGIVGFRGILLIDFVTFLFAAGTLLLVAIPSPARAAAPGKKPPIWREAVYGWRYLLERRGLAGLVAVFAVVNLAMAVAQGVYQPMVLSTASPAALGTISSVGGAGMLAGSLLMSVWGGPRRKIHGVLGAAGLAGLFHVLFGSRAALPVWAAALFGVLFTVPFVTGSVTAVMMRKVAPEVQGRVFATIQMVAMSSAPIAYLAAGPLADRVFEPLLRPGGALAGSVGSVIGVGPGRGMGMMMIVAGAVIVAATLAGILDPRIRNLEEELPDAIDAAPTPPAQPEPAAAGAAD